MAKVKTFLMKTRRDRKRAKNYLINFLNKLKNNKPKKMSSRIFIKLKIKESKIHI
jgi:hypothetical protein